MDALENASDEAKRLFTTMRDLKKVYSELPKTPGFTVGIIFSEKSKSSLMLTEPEDLIIFTFGLGAHKVPELVFLLGPGRNEAAMPTADAFSLASDLLSMLDVSAALDISGDTAITPDGVELLIGTLNRKRIYKEIHPGKNSLKLLERNFIKEKYLTDLTSSYQGKMYDIAVFEHKNWIS